jgi:6,7-dimethyl-8-ribityllumazine synthase
MNQTPVATGAPDLSIAFVQACWHRDIVDRGHAGFVAEIGRLGIPPQQVHRFEVPGSLELPLHAKLLAASGRYAAVVAAGFVVDGGIYRHEFVAQAVIDGLMSVQLETEVPVLSMVLTPQHFHEHAEHVAFFTEHMSKKGAEAAQACQQSLEALQRIRQLARAHAA